MAVLLAPVSASLDERIVTKVMLTTRDGLTASFARVDLRGFGFEQVERRHGRTIIA